MGKPGREGEGTDLDGKFCNSVEDTLHLTRRWWDIHFGYVCLEPRISSM